MVTLNARAGDNCRLSRFEPDADLLRIRPWRAWAALAGDWSLIAVAFASTMLWPHPLIWISAAIIIARTQLALAVLMHESAHGILLPQQRYNDALGQACAAGPLFLSLQTYRAGHLMHHLAPMRHGDPVATVFQIIDYPIPRRKLAMRLLGDLSGVAYCISAFKLIRGDYREIIPHTPKTRRDQIWEVSSMLVSNALLAGLLALCGHPLLYLALWVVPAVTLLPLMGRIRALMEHAGLPEHADQSRNARTIIRPSWQTFLFGPHGIHYHIEHHLFVRMPFYNLGKVHDQLTDLNLLAEDNLYESYGTVLRDVTY